MRCIVYLLCLAFSASAGTPEELQRTVQALAAEHEGGLTLYAEDLKTGNTVAIEPDRKVPTASVIKLAILFEALEQVRSGKAKLEDKHTLKKQDQVAGSGVLLFFDTPLEITFKDALSMMVIMSDNAATNLVIDHIGFPTVNQRMDSIGLRTTHLFNKVFARSPMALAPELEADHKKFGLGSTTAREMGSLIKRFYTCDLGSTEIPAQPMDKPLCETALTLLSKQFYRDAIPRYLDGWNAPGTGDRPALGNKTGSLDRVRNDVALVAGFRGPIVISAFTFDNKDQSWQADNEGELTIAKIARAIVKAWSPEGLAPNQYKVRESK
jgi:beta-lactamase class A